MRRLVQVGSLVVVLFAAALFFIPSERVDRSGSVTAELGDPDAYLAAREAAYGDITPGAEARIIWAGTAGEPTPLSIVYLHGFSATSEEIRPVPDRVAAALGANLMFARLRGHGRDGAALADATSGQWVDDTAEALAIGRAIGDRVLVIGVSTGATLAAIAATEPDMAERVSGIVMISGNFRLANPGAVLLDAPGIELWGEWIMGAERSFEPLNNGHEMFWTTRYPSRAVYSLAAAMREARRRDYTQTEIPLLMVYAAEDQVISAEAVETIAESWGGAVTLAPQDLPEEGVDPFAHVIAGDIMSPAMTVPVTDLITTWSRDTLSIP